MSTDINECTPLLSYYLQVKSTLAVSRDFFPMSREELSCAAQTGDAYKIARLTGAGASMWMAEWFCVCCACLSVSCSLNR